MRISNHHWVQEEQFVVSDILCMKETFVLPFLRRRWQRNKMRLLVLQNSCLVRINNPIITNVADVIFLRTYILVCFWDFLNFAPVINVKLDFFFFIKIRFNQDIWKLVRTHHKLDKKKKRLFSYLNKNLKQLYNFFSHFVAKKESENSKRNHWFHIWLCSWKK